MTANVSITVDTRHDVLRVPNAALRFKPAMAAEKNEIREEKTIKGTKVWILEQEKPKPVQVTIGISDGNYTEMLSGQLEAGQDIITDNLNDKKGNSSTQRPPPRFM